MSEIFIVYCSIIAIITIGYSISNIVISKYLLSGIFAILILVWILQLGCCVQDMRTYAEHCSTATFSSASLYESQFLIESTLGYICSILSGIIGTNDKHVLIFVVRICFYIFFPAIIIATSPSNYIAKYRFVALSTITVIFPYTFLGAVNIFHNGLSVHSFIIALMSWENIILTSNTSKRSKRRYLLITVVLLLMSMFAHAIGIILVTVAFVALCYGYNILNISLLSISNKVLIKLPFIWNLLIISGILGISFTVFANSQVQDVTALTNALMCMVSLTFFWIRVNHSGQQTIEYKRYMLTNYTFLTVLSLSSTVFALLDGGDAAERLLMASIMVNVVLCFSPIISGALANKASINKINQSKTTYYSLFIIALMTVFNIYFYNSNAFYTNFIGS